MWGKATKWNIIYIHLSPVGKWEDRHMSIGDIFIHTLERDGDKVWQGIGGREGRDWEGGGQASTRTIGFKFCIQRWICSHWKWKMEFNGRDKGQSSAMSSWWCYCGQAVVWFCVMNSLVESPGLEQWLLVTWTGGSGRAGKDSWVPVKVAAGSVELWRDHGELWVWNVKQIWQEVRNKRLEMKWMPKLPSQLCQHSFWLVGAQTVQLWLFWLLVFWLLAGKMSRCNDNKMLLLKSQFGES